MGVSAKTVLSGLIQAATDLLYPRNCQFCSVPLAGQERGVICAGCLETVKWIEPPCCSRCALPFVGAVTGTFECGYCQDLDLHFSRAVSACVARGVVLDAIHHFKYHRRMYFGPHLAEWMVTAGRERLDWSTVDGVVPVPLHPRKKRERGFKQAEYLAKAAGQAFGKPVWRRALRRVHDTKTQTRLDAQERRENLRGAFTVRDSGSVAEKRIVLVDDVFTTGATLDACARVLRHAGAREVWVLTVARGAYL
jgi:ComF family protein